MKAIKYIFIMILAVGSILNKSYAQNSKAISNVDDSSIALQGYSPVSYLDLGIAQRGLQSFKSTHAGLHYYFTSSDQKKKFDSNPEKYLPQYGGFCAFGVSVGAKFRVDPNKFIVKDGKYFLFLYDVEVDAQQLWLNGEHQKLVAKANDNWKKLSVK